MVITWQNFIISRFSYSAMSLLILYSVAGNRGAGDYAADIVLAIDFHKLGSCSSD